MKTFEVILLIAMSELKEDPESDSPFPMVKKLSWQELGLWECLLPAKNAKGKGCLAISGIKSMSVKNHCIRTAVATQ